MVALLLLAGCADASSLFQRGQVMEARQKLDAGVIEGAFCTKLSGIVFAAMGDYRSAVRPFEKACRMDAGEPDACYYWGRALYALNRFEDSLVALGMARGGVAWKLDTARGQAMDALGRAEAEGVLRQALEARLKLDLPVVEPDPLLALASFLHRQGRREEVMRLLAGAPQRYQKVAAYQYQHGRVLSGMQRWQKAAEALERAVGLEPGNAEAHGLLSRAYYRLGKDELGARHARLAVSESR